MRKIFLENEHIRMEVLLVGCVIHKLETKNKAGIFENIVLGYKDVRQYMVPRANFGAVVGPVAGRIKDACFELGGKAYHLEQNNNGNNLHSGHANFALYDWEVIEQTEVSVTFLLEQTPEDGGFPGNVRTTVTYQLENNSLHLIYKGLSDETTIWDPTQHTYWNLSGNMQDSNILEHQLQITADTFGAIDAKGMVTNILQTVEGRPFDVRMPRRIGDIISESDLQLTNGGKGFDHPFLLNPNPTIRLSHPISGRLLSIQTDTPAVVCYMASQLDGTIELQEGIFAEEYAGICLETQYLPNAINTPNYGAAPLLPKGQDVTRRTTFTFTINA